MKNSKTHLYNVVWKKYVPVIRILLKKSAAEEQAFIINRIDFERAGIGRKAGYKFFVSFVNGKPDAIFTENELVQSFIAALQEDEAIRQQVLQNNYTFTLGSNYQFRIKNTSLPKEDQPLLEEEALDEQ